MITTTTRSSPHKPLWRSLLPGKAAVSAVCVGYLIAGGCGHKATAPVHDEVDYSTATDLFSAPLSGFGPAAADLAEPVAIVSGEEISRGALRQEVQLRLVALRQRVPPEQLEQLAPRVEQEALQALIVAVLLRDAIEAEGVSVTDAEVDERMEVIKENLPEGAAWDEVLAGNQLTDEAVREQIRAGLKRDKLLSSHVQDVAEPDEAAVQTFFDENQERFLQPPMAEVRHLLVRVEKDAEEKAWDAAREKARTLRESLGGEVSFEELISLHSDDDESRADGGLISDVTQRNLFPALHEFVFEGETGVVSEAIKTPVGYHLVRVESREAERPLEFAEVEERIRSGLLEQNRQAAIRGYIEELASQAEVVFPGRPEAPAEAAGTETPETEAAEPEAEAPAPEPEPAAEAP